MPDREFTNINGIKVCDQTARDRIPTKTSQLQNDSDFATNSSVDSKINAKAEELNNRIDNIGGSSGGSSEGSAVTIDGSRLAYFIKSETNDYTDALNELLTSMPARGKIIFPQGEEIFLGKINPIDRPIKIDFNYCKIRPAASAANQVMFELKFIRR